MPPHYALLILLVLVLLLLLLVSQGNKRTIDVNLDKAIFLIRRNNTWKYYQIGIYLGSGITIVEKLVNIALQELVKMLGNMPREIHDKTFLKMYVSYACLTERERENYTNTIGEYNKWL